MKRLTLLITACLLCGLAVSAQSNTFAILHHGGEQVLYDGDNLQTVLEIAQEGDTIFLSEGFFPSVTINKKITLRGSGQKTHISGHLNIKIISNDLKLNAAVAEGMIVDGHLTVDCNVDGLHIKHCSFKSGTFYGTLTNVLIDRCQFKDVLNIPKESDTFICSYSSIESLKGVSLSDNKATFINCDVTYGYWDTTAGRFVNCRLKDYQNNSAIQASLLINTLICSSKISFGSSSTYYNCYEYSDYDNFWLGETELLTNEFMGTDGYVVGKWSGKQPYTDCVPLVPKVQTGIVKVSSDQKKLEVNISMSPN